MKLTKAHLLLLKNEIVGRVAAAREAAGATAARQPSFAKALGVPAAHRHLHARAAPPGCPGGRSIPPRGRERRSPRGGRHGCQLQNLGLQELKPKKAGKDKS